MHSRTAAEWAHDHSFGQTERHSHETRVLVIVLVTFAAMLVEIAAGWITGSMALLADGVHMGTHAIALGLTYAAFALSRRHARNRAFSLGTGKIGELAGFASALLLAVSALLMAGEAIWRLIEPRPIVYGEAIAVAVFGLAVNVASALLLAGRHGPPHGHAHGHGHEHRERAPADGPDPHPGDDRHDHHHDNNTRAAFLHVLADALTSIAAIVALVAARAFDWVWLDAVTALAATGVILAWAFGLARDTARVLVDAEAPAEVREAVRTALEADGDSTVVDLHLWSVGSGAWTLVASVVTHGGRDPDDYRRTLPRDLRLHHPIIEVRRCRGEASEHG